MNVADVQMMARALRLAARGRYRSRPNPAVGCVLVRDGEIVGEGSTQPAGSNHAEIEALQQCPNPRGSTAYVTLEPCSHVGRTGACADALISAGVARVVVAMRDPNPQVAGAGISRLKQAGIEVSEGVLQAEAAKINRGFFQRMESGRPRLRAKLASSLDGRTAMASGESQWITGAAARADVQKWRALSGAIVTGVGTVIQDDPAMTVRDNALDIPAQPLRVIVDSNLRTPPQAAILGQPGETLIVYAQENENMQALQAAGAELLQLAAASARVDLAALVAELAARQCNDILVECGARLAGSFLQQGLLDEIILYMAPSLMGSSARPLLDLPLVAMHEKRQFEVLDLRQVGDDYRWVLQVKDTAEE